MAKLDKETPQKGSYFCPKCQEEFQGTECPTCGNKKNNTRLASDGIDQNLHTTASLFGDNANFMSADDAQMGMMRARQASEQINDFNDNMRNAYVIKSEIKQKELELEKMKKDAQIREQKALLESGQSVLNPSTRGFQQNPQDASGQMNGMFMGMNPQTAFMSQLMKMDKDKRKDFMEQLSDADPQALQALGAMMAPAQQYNPQMNPMMNPGGMSMNPYNMTPWQQMQMGAYHPVPQPAPQQQENSLETALGLVAAIQDIMAKNAPKPDDTLKDIIKEMRDEQKALREKLDSRQNEVSSHNMMQPLINEIAQLKQQMAPAVPRQSIGDTLNEVNVLIDGLERTGLVSRHGGKDTTIDDEIKMKKVNHEIATEEKKLQMEQDKIESDKAKLGLGQAMMTALMNRQMKPKQSPDDPKKVNSINTRSVSTVSESRSPTVIEEHVTDGGSVNEIKSASVKGQVL